MGEAFNGIALLVIAVYFVAIIYLLKKGRLYLRYVLLWMLTGAVMALLAVCPQTISWFFKLCGFQLFSNGLFAVLIFFIFLILLAITSIVSELNEKNRKLAQRIALLEKRVRELENENEA